MDNFVITTALKKILKAQKRKVVCSGGTSIGKTVGIIAILIDYCAKNPKRRVLVCGETIPSVRQGCITLFKEIMEITDRWYEDRFNNTDRIYTFGNGATIQFTSFDTIGKAKASGKRDVLFLNEANHIPFVIANELMVRTNERIYLDFNPSEECWIHTELLKDEDAELVELFYWDNEALSDNIKNELLSRLEKAKTSEYWRNWCDVYIYGKIGSRQGIIFEDHEIIDYIPEGANLIGYGLDFGFTNDPTAMVEVWKMGESYILNELLYRTRMTNNDIADFVKQSKITNLIIADSAEPKSIEELKRQGLNITGAIKGKDSVMAGLDLMLQNTLFITSNSLNLIREVRNYRWIQDRNTNEYLNEPIDEENHALDCSRYTIFYHNQIKDNKTRVFNF